MSTTARVVRYRPRFDFDSPGWAYYLSDQPGVTWTTDPEDARSFDSPESARAAGMHRTPGDATLRVEAFTIDD